MNEIFVKPAVGAIITKQTDNNEFILVQDRKKNSADGTDGLLEIPAGKIREYENIFDALKYGRKQDFILHKYRAKKTAIL